jgi:hypothetical protein
MHRSKVICMIVSLIIILSSCIKRYDPEIKSTDTNKLVVTGQVIKGNPVQKINISKTAAINEPKSKYYVPVTGCKVSIVDDKGNTYNAGETGKGNYESSIPDSKLVAGVSFKVQILTPAGENIVSDFDLLLDCPDLDTLYYHVEQLPTSDPYLAIDGIRFYCNLDAKESNCRNFRWEAIETWEYRAIFATASIRKTCWMTAMVQDIFTLSTKNLTENIYNNFPLHFVDNYSSQRLLYGYSLLVRQYSLSEANYEYWGKLTKNYAEQGGLYSTQPLKIKGNMHNLTHPDQQVLGFFGASTVKEKRIFVDNIQGLEMEYLDCEPPAQPGPSPPPEPTCFNCLLEGGTNVKPAFWPY